MTARMHHWISQGYLRGFARPGATDHVWAYDFKADKSFTPNTQNVGAVRDFNRVDIDGHAPDVIETAMADFEGQAISAIRATAAGGGLFPDDEARTNILNLMALFAVRNPRFRELRRDFKAHISEGIMDIALSSKEMYEGQIAQAKAAGFVRADAEVSYERARDFHRRKEYTIEVARESQIAEEVKLHDDVLQTLGRREWAVIRATPASGQFITCDHPVLLRPTRPGITRLGFGLRAAAVLFPLTKDAFLIGEFDMDPYVKQASRTDVAALNTEIILEAERQVYASDDTFPIFNPNTGELTTGGQLCAAFRHGDDERVEDEDNS
jgi:hypothetical protein